MARRIAVYADTNVLYPYCISDLLLWLASDGVIRLNWTQYLVDELVDVVPRRHQSRARGRDELSVRRQWSAATGHLWRDEVTAAQWEAKMHLAVGPDPADHPHQAAALYAQVDYLLTHDYKGFPPAQLAVHGVKVSGVDDFLCILMESEPEHVLDTLRQRAKGLDRPPMTLEQYVEVLSVTAPTFGALVTRE